MLKLTSLLAILAATTIAGAIAISSSLASQGSIFVDRLDDPAPDGCATNGCSLREAVAQANAGSGQQTIELPAGTITLQSGSITISGNVSISGEGAGSTVINGNGTRSFTVTGTASLDHLTVRGAAGSPGCGGAIQNSGDITLSHVELTGNDITGQGAGLCNTGTATITDSDISGNAASNNSAGAGIHNSGTMTITASNIDDNTARGVNGGGDGAAIANATAATLTIEGSTVSGNTGASTTCDDCSSGAISNDGTLTIRRSTLDSNQADNYAALQNKGTVTIEKSTVSRNTYGSILNSQASSLTIINSTISGNNAGPYPKGGMGGISNNGTVSISSSTITNNGSTQFLYGGIYNSNQSFQTSIRSSIIANNGQENCSQGGTIVSNGFNIVDDGTCRLNGGTDQVVADAGLKALADNGGPTETHELESDSPAIDSGGGSTACATDQRDAPRNPVECDSGSFELGADPPTPTPVPTATPEPAAYPMGDFNCNDHIDGGDITSGLRLATQLDEPSDCGRDAIPCFDFESHCYPWWSDTDCNEAVTATDPLRVVLHLGGAPIEDSCTPVGEMPGT